MCLNDWSEKMKNKTKKILILGACTLLLCGCGKTIPTLSDGSQAVVSFNEGTESISANQLYEKMKENYSLNAILTLMDTEILENKYPDELEEARDEAESTIDSLIGTYGEDQVIAMYGSISGGEETLYLSNLRNKAILDYAKSLITEDEITAYYNSNIYGDVTVDHILITTGVTEDTSEEDKTKLEEEAKAQVDEIIEKLNAAEDKLATFKELAKEYSDDTATKDNGGSLGAINTGTLSSDYDEILKAARNLKDGEYSTELITTSLGYHVIFRESSSEKPSLEDSRDDVVESLANNKLDEDQTLQVTALDELRKEYGMTINDSDIASKYSAYIANQIASIQSSQSSN